MQCRVTGCRFPLFHVTSGHQCGSCHEYGHGILECGSESSMQKLSRHHSDRVRVSCSVFGCRYADLHSTEGHRCYHCGAFGHASRDHIACPVCRMRQVRGTFIGTFVESRCVVCFEHRNVNISTACMHGVCPTCLAHL